MGLLRPLLQRRQLWVASVLGAMLHNLGQLLTALWITATPGLLAYLPVLLLSGMATGLFTGLAAQALVLRLRPLYLLRPQLQYTLSLCCRGRLRHQHHLLRPN